MKRPHYLPLFSLMCGLSLLLSGCLIKPARAPVRYYILAPIPAPESTPTAAPHWSVDVGLVKMPSYLMRPSMAVRKSATEIEYLEDALWAERLDQCFRQTLAQNLSLLLGSERVGIPPSEHGEVKVSVDVKQFDVDTQGRGTLVALWRLTLPGGNKPMKSGEARLVRPGPASPASPQVIATILSDLTAQFSRELVQRIRE